MRKTLAVTLILSVSLVLTSCGKSEEPSVQELQTQIATLTGTQAKLESQVKSLKTLLYNYDSTLAEVSDLSAVKQLPTGKRAYNAINNYIRLGDQLDLKPSVALPNNTTIELVSGVTYKPSNNWSFDLSNGTVSLLHKNGMYVTLRAYSYVGKSTPYDAYDTILKPYLSGLAVTELNKKTLFIGNQTVGAMVVSQCYVVTSSTGSVMEGTKATTGETTGETTGQTVETSPNTTETLKSANTGTMSLDDIVGTAEQATTESASAGAEQSSIASTETTEEKKSEEVKKDIVSDYRYVVGVLLDGSTGIIFEAFYPQDDNASIQEELLESCLNSISIRNNQVKSQ